MSAEVWNLVGGVWVIKSVELCNLVRLNKLVENWILVRLNKSAEVWVRLNKSAEVWVMLNKSAEVWNLVGVIKSVELEIKFSWVKRAWRNLQSNRVEKIEGKLIESDEF